MQGQFLPLLGFLIAGSLIAGAVAIRWVWKLRDGTLHLLEQWPAARTLADAQPRPEPEQPIRKAPTPLED
jgi:hypothetical protein